MVDIQSISFKNMAALRIFDIDLYMQIVTRLITAIELLGCQGNLDGTSHDYLGVQDRFFWPPLWILPPPYLHTWLPIA